MILNILLYLSCIVYKSKYFFNYIFIFLNLGIFNNKKNFQACYIIIV